MQINCKNCNVEFYKLDRFVRRSSSHFCSRSCAAKFNNSLIPKRKSQNTTNCACGANKDYRAKTCQQCLVAQTRKRQRDRTIGETLCNGASRAKYNTIRFLARQIMEESGQEKKCKYCDFSAVVEVCHVKAIKNFDTSDLLSTVNALDNLMYLCPNHHALLDLGMALRSGVEPLLAG